MRSVDYPEAAKKLIDNSTPKSLRNSLFQLFSIEGKINKSLFRSHDLSGYLLLSEMIGGSELYSGQLIIKISTFCADKSLDLLSEALLGFGIMLSLEYSSINVSVGIRQSSIVSDYERYFGNLAESCCSIPDELIVKERTQSSQGSIIFALRAIILRTFFEVFSIATVVVISYPSPIES